MTADMIVALDSGRQVLVQKSTSPYAHRKYPWVVIDLATREFLAGGFESRRDAEIVARRLDEA